MSHSPKVAAFTLDHDSELKGSALAVLEGKTANINPAIAALLGAGSGAALGGLGGTIYGGIQGLDAGAGRSPEGQALLADPTTADMTNLANHAAGGVVGGLTGATGGAVLGGGAGLAYGLMNRNQDPNMQRTAAFTLDLDSDVEGSAIDVLTTKVAALGTTLGTLAGIGGGALLGHYATPAMHWAISPGEHAAMGNLAQTEVAGPAQQAVDPSATPEAQAAAQAQLQAGLGHMTDPNFIQGAQAGAGSARDAAWRGMSELGTVAGAGIGGITGYQAGRGLDQAFGLERKDRPMVIAPMQPRF